MQHPRRRAGERIERRQPGREREPGRQCRPPQIEQAVEPVELENIIAHLEQRSSDIIRRRADEIDLVENVAAQAHKIVTDPIGVAASHLTELLLDQRVRAFEAAPDQDAVGGPEIGIPACVQRPSLTFVTQPSLYAFQRGRGSLRMEVEIGDDMDHDGLKHLLDVFLGSLRPGRLARPHTVYDVIWTMGFPLSGLLFRMA